MLSRGGGGRRGANRKSQVLFPIVNMVENNGRKLISLN